MQSVSNPKRISFMFKSNLNKIIGFKDETEAQPNLTLAFNS
ncbi:hypothetical protein ECP030477713_5021 [Escherichia coli P0304777.13]|nr:hypothetical protein ECP030477713_5021 [Escherichia coli P0304777.13]